MSNDISTDTAKVRNFSIIAHIDHGKSTLADRLLEQTNTVSQREMKAQLLDSMDLEREKGITIKARAVRMSYTARDGETYQLNLIDTPGHVDFSYEVSRSLAACEGALLVVDAAQGIEAQTMANVYLALEQDLAIVAVINKIDLPSADPQKVAAEVGQLIGLLDDEIVQASAKTGLGVEDILESVVRHMPPPRGNPAGRVRALIFDSHYDPYKGVIAYVKIVDGRITAGDRIKLMANGKEAELLEVGYFDPELHPAGALGTGEVGYIATGLKIVQDVQVGDTVTLASVPAVEQLPGYRPVKPMVFAGLYPMESEDYPMLRDALERLRLNDGSLTWEPESSDALGFGFRCGFLGLLHMEIIQERLEREFNLDLISTVPTVEYHVYKTDGTMLHVENPTLLPDPASIERIEEPFVKARIMAPTDYIGGIMKLGQDRRGIYNGMHYLDTQRVEFDFEFPLGEIVLDFYDKLKSLSRGYASLDYEAADYRESDLVKLDMLINGDAIDAFSVITHRDKAYEWGRKIADKLKELIPRQLFEVAIQAAIGTKVIARTTVKALRKDVLAKCYGGDISRKRKLLEKQKEGKKRMKQVGAVEIPQEAFLAVLQVE